MWNGNKYGLILRRMSVSSEAGRAGEDRRCQDPRKRWRELQSRLAADAGAEARLWR